MAGEQALPHSPTHSATAPQSGGTGTKQRSSPVVSDRSGLRLVQKDPIGESGISINIVDEPTDTIKIQDRDINLDLQF
jgi:hypothetical protein